MKLTALFLVPSLVHAFVPVVPRPAEKTTARLAAKSSTGGGSQHQGSDSTSSIQEPHFSSSWMLPLVSTAAAACLTLTAAPAWAVSGGGLDFAGTDISGQIFSNGNYKGKDFTQVLAKMTNFAGSNLQGCRFYKAYLVGTDFSGSDIRGASLEDTSMDDANLKNVIASGTYFSASILDTKSVENGDFTDAQLPLKTLTQLCLREDVKGTNPTTGVDTRDSLMCP